MDYIACWAFCILLSVTTSGIFTQETELSSDEMRLVNDLMKRSGPNKAHIRPIINTSETVTVEFGISLQQILEFDEMNQIMTSLVWKQFSWTDQFHTWNASDYGDVDQIVLPRSALWTPDIILYNNVGKRSEEIAVKDKVVLYSDGKVKWIPAVIFQSTCPVDMTNYPFDTQVCLMKFGSWTYDKSKIDLAHFAAEDSADLSEYTPSTEWEIVENTAKRTENKYACCEHPYPDITVSLKLRRNMTFHIRLILMPTVLLSIMSVGIFLVPPHRPDRTGIGLSLFSSFFLLLILVVNSSPPSAETRIGSYYMIIIVLVASGIFLSVLCINVTTWTRRVPHFIDKIFIPCLSWLICGGCAKNSSCCRSKETPAHLQDPVETRLTSKGVTVESAPAEMSGAEKKKSNNDKWRTTALICDRIFLIIFSIAVLLAYLVVFPKPE